MNYSTIKYFDIANGEGVRTSLFVSGCRRHCPFCFNEEAWDFAAGAPFTPDVQDEIIASLKPAYVDGFSLLGGEPMEPENQRDIVDFLERLKAEFPTKSIWCFTGDVLDGELAPGGAHHIEVTDRVLSCIDILVDGPFIQAQHDITLRFRGSANQRLIDMNATRERAAACGGTLGSSIELWHDAEIYATHSMK